jgi:acyl homoserine lactone synthase
LTASYALRHKVYAEALKWVPTSVDELEVDAYDDWGTSLGVFSEIGDMVGVIRLLPSYGPFMLETEFQSCMAPGYRFRKERDTNEITRLTVDPSLTDKGLSSRMLLVLLKGLYQWLIHNDVQYSYMVIEKRFLRVLHRLGFPARPISPFSALPPAGAVCGAALLDWEEFRVENMTKRPAFFEWMSTVGGKAPVHAMDSDLEPAAGGIRQWLEGQGNLRTEPDRSFVGAS